MANQIYEELKKRPTITNFLFCALIITVYCLIAVALYIANIFFMPQLQHSTAYLYEWVQGSVNIVMAT